MIYIQSVGGLGNQLFQVAFAHNLIERYPKEEIIIFKDKYHGTERVNEIATVLKSCKHNIRIIRSNRLGLLLKVLDKTARHSDKSSRSICYLLRILSDNESAFDQSRKGKIYRGYFQAPNLMESAVLITGDELSNTLENLKFEMPMKGNFSALHIRRGDFLENKETIGILSSRYYSQKIMGNSQLVIATDTYPLDETFKKSCHDALVLDPAKFSPLHTLAILSTSSVLAIANSTFSWWAGVLVKLKGNAVYGPTPWTKNANSESEIYWEKFEWIDADYE